MLDDSGTVALQAGCSGSQRKPIRVVIADDHAIFRDGLRKLLSLEEDLCVVGEARDGNEVMQALQEHEPDILLLDLKMPGRNALELLEKLQAENAETKVIVLTASEDKSEFVQAMKSGASGIVVKHTATELLMKSIREVHAGGIWLDSETTAAVIRQFAATAEVAVRTRNREHDCSSLSPREREIVVWVAQGYKNKEIAQKMFISEQTVKNHLHNIFDKLGVSDRLELALFAIHQNLHIGQQLSAPRAWRARDLPGFGE